MHWGNAGAEEVDCVGFVGWWSLAMGGSGPMNAVIADFLVFLAIGVMMMSHRYVDAFNVIFGLMTCHALHRKPVPYRFTGPSLLGAQAYAFIMCTFFVVTHMWWEAAYQFSCGSNILFTFLCAEEVTV